MSFIRVREMKIIFHILIVFDLCWITNSVNIYEPARIPGWNYFGYSWTEPKPSVVFRKPMAAMVDLTNDLGVAILQDYSYSRSNFAFSPYGVASVLVVLYEGTRGESARQIHRAVKFPWDRDIIRIGFRDIHRHLRSYFSHEGYLSGITLSKEGSSLKPEYKRILRFYGYDVDVDSPEGNIDPPSPSTPESETSSTSSTGTTTPANEVSTVGGNITNVQADTEETNIVTNTVKTEESTTLGLDEITSTVMEEREPPTTSIVSSITTEPTEMTTPELSEIKTSTENDATETVTKHLDDSGYGETDTPNETTTEDLDLLVLNSTTEGIETTAGSGEADDLESTTPAAVTEELAVMKEVERAGHVTSGDGDKKSDYTFDNGMLIPQPPTNGHYSYFDAKSGLLYNIPEKRNVIDGAEKSKSSSGNWKKKPEVALIADGDRVKWEPKTLDELLMNLMTANKEIDGANRTQRQTVSQRKRLQKSTYYPEGYSDNAPVEETGKMRRRKAVPADFETSVRLKRKNPTKEKRNISDFMKIPAVTDLSLQLQNGMFDSHVSKDRDLYRALPKFLFLVDGAIDTPVPMMTYTNVFPFAYIPRLHAKALEFPLDDERYKLLILLPVERRGLRQLIYDLGSYPLREVIDLLHLTRVKAMVPTFMVEGFVILTPTLQKLGIWDVFDPRRSDLSGMTSDPELYVRNIEQSVTVVIRNYVEILDIQTRTMAARDIDEEFTASHPFLYFVMDTATNVALMAGQMLDPLNSRIY